MKSKELIGMYESIKKEIFLRNNAVKNCKERSGVNAECNIKNNKS